MVKKNIKFTPEEDAVIRLYYPFGGSTECCKHLVDRMLSSITKRAGILGIKFEGSTNIFNAAFKRSIDCGVHKKNNRIWKW